MNIKITFQSAGTISAMVLSYLSFELSKYINELSLDFSTSLEYGHFSLILITVLIFMFTGFSYADSRHEHEGLNHALYFSLGIVHIFIAPVAFMIAIMKIEFGQYWFAVLLLLVFLIWRKPNKDKNSN